MGSYRYDAQALQPLEMPEVVAQQGETVPQRGAAVKSVSCPVGIYEIAHSGLALLLLPCAGTAGLGRYPV